MKDEEIYFDNRVCNKGGIKKKLLSLVKRYIAFLNSEEHKQDMKETFLSFFIIIPISFIFGFYYADFLLTRSIFIIQKFDLKTFVLFRFFVSRFLKFSVGFQLFLERIICKISKGKYFSDSFDY